MKKIINVPTWFYYLWIICMLVAASIIGYATYKWYINETTIITKYSLLSTFGSINEDNNYSYPSFCNSELVTFTEYKDLLPDYELTLNKKKDRSSRFDNKDNKSKIVVWSWKGGNTIKKDQLTNTINAVLARLDHIPNHENITNLLLETAAVESHRGQYITQLNGGPARGIYQMESNTIVDTLNWLKKYHKDVYKSVQVFYNKKESEEWNYKHNVPWQTAMAITYYWRLGGSDIADLSSTKYDRAMIYKLYWNTKKGKTTIKKYYKDTEDFA